MTTIITTTADEPTGPYVDQLPFMLPTMGVTGYEERWAARQLLASLDSGDSVDTWSSINGAEFRTPGGSPLLTTLDSVAAVAMDGADDNLVCDGFSDIKTLFIVGKITAASGTVHLLDIDNSDVRVTLGSTGRYLWYAPGAANSSPTNVYDHWDSWITLALTFSATEMRAYVNGVLHATIASDGSNLFDLTLGQVKASGFGALAVSEVVVFEADTLTGTDVAAMHAAAKAANVNLA